MNNETPKLIQIVYNEKLNSIVGLSSNGDLYVLKSDYDRRGPTHNWELIAKNPA